VTERKIRKKNLNILIKVFTDLIKVIKILFNLVNRIRIKIMLYYLNSFPNNLNRSSDELFIISFLTPITVITFDNIIIYPKYKSKKVSSILLLFKKVMINYLTNKRRRRENKVSTNIYPEIFSSKKFNTITLIR
jgi:hypothetical protein